MFLSLLLKFCSVLAVVLTYLSLTTGGRQPLYHRLQVMATDNGYPFALTSEAVVVVKIQPRNLHRPVLEPSSRAIAVDQSAPAHTVVSSNFVLIFEKCFLKNVEIFSEKIC